MWFQLLSSSSLGTKTGTRTERWPDAETRTLLLTRREKKDKTVTFECMCVHTEESVWCQLRN